MGMFDGVHKGHQYLIDKLLNIASSRQCQTTVVTFWPHPRLVLGADVPNLKFITTQDEKISKLSMLGIDNLIIIPFTKAFSELSAQSFLNDILVKQIGCSTLLMGFNHRFGSNSDLTVSDYDKLAASCGVSIVHEQPILINDYVCSSSAIRELIDNGNIEMANKLLGYPYTLSGIVVSGEQIGRKLTFPTANIELDSEDKLIPKVGVYACWTTIENRKYASMVNIGYRPTVNSLNHLSIEAHILDYSGDIYGKKISIELVKRLRDEQNFMSLQLLKEQLMLDEKVVRQLLQQ